ncbi:MAG: hypothetical protein M1830_003048 [Pleopsidium flavum]|nr:MAG: hypothetical protein M1830_003048 [Pleopsidium flavum]
MAITTSRDPLVWIDCEMTGLDVYTNSILQISCFITDYQLKLLDIEGWGAIIHHEKAVLDKMDEWCTRTHASTGLTAAAIASSTTAEEAAHGLLNYIQKHVPEPRTALLAGNSVHADKAFLSCVPFDKVLSHLHYRILDVSTIKEAVRRWAPREMVEMIPKKKNLHEAREDILESIQEARFYQKTFFERGILGLYKG